MPPTKLCPPGTDPGTQSHSSPGNPFQRVGELCPECGEATLINERRAVANATPAGIVVLKAQLITEGPHPFGIDETFLLLNIFIQLSVIFHRVFPKTSPFNQIMTFQKPLNDNYSVRRANLPPHLSGGEHFVNRLIFTTWLQTVVS